MNKSEFWKLIHYIEDECEPSTLRWFEGMALFYAMHSEECDKWVSAFKFFDEEE